MARDMPAPHTGTITPGPVGWTRIGVIVGLAIAVTVVVIIKLGSGGAPLALAVLVVSLGYAFVTWLRLHITFRIDANGITPKLGGVWARGMWPAETFRTVQLRKVAPSLVGSTIGNIGLRSGFVTSSRRNDVAPVSGLKVRNSTEPRVDATYAVTRGGTLVEIVRKDGGVYLLNSNEPHATAEAVAEVIRFWR